MNKCGCGPAPQQYLEFPINDNLTTSTFSTDLNPVGFPQTTCDNELRLKVIEEFCGIVKNLQCGVQQNLDFILEEISLLSKHKYEQDDSIYAQYDMSNPIFQELNIDIDNLTPEQINKLLESYRKLILVLKGPQGNKGDKGDKGDPFTYEDFTPEQLAGLKGDPLRFQDLTQAEIESLRGAKGEDGADGANGADGKDGTSSYIHLAYSSSANGSSNFSTEYFEGATYMGICVSSNNVTPYTYESYTWARIKGDAGEPFKYSNFTQEQLNSLKGPQGEGVNITSTSVTYAISDTNERPEDYLFEYAIVPPTPQKGKYIWTKTIVHYSDGNSTKTYTVSYQGQDGQAGQSGNNGYTTHFAYSTSADGFENFSKVLFPEATYIGSYTDNSPTDSSDYRVYQWARFRGVDGTNGRDGVDGTPITIISTAVRYALSNTGTKPQDVDFVYSDIPPLEQGKYVWTLTEITYSDNSTIKQYSVNRIGRDGTNGENGSDGINGAVPYIDLQTGYWFVQGINTGVKAQGPAGKDGKDGKDGIDGVNGNNGIDGATFIPSIDEYGYISWTNNKNLVNPNPVNVKGADGAPGASGATFTPQVDSQTGDLSWTNDKGLTNPTTVNIKGDPGVTKYIWIKYATDQYGSNMSSTYSSNKKYIGLAFNKDSETPSTQANQYNWFKFIGDNGENGNDGTSHSVQIGENKHWILDGVDTDIVAEGQQGDPGEPGDTLYTYIKYSDNYNGYQMTDSPINTSTGKYKKYIGISTNNISTTAPEDANAYTWSLILKDTPKWIFGTALTGTNLRVIHNVNNSNDGDLYVNTNTGNVYQCESAEARAWNYVCNLKGDTSLLNINESGNWTIDGVDTGRKAQGDPSYTWIMFADDVSGTNMSSSPLDTTTNTYRKYMGIAYNKSTASPDQNSTYQDYTWIKVVGEIGQTPTIECASGENINSVGTPSVTKSVNGNTVTFTFNNLKGQQGDSGLTQEQLQEILEPCINGSLKRTLIKGKTDTIKVNNGKINSVSFSESGILSKGSIINNNSIPITALGVGTTNVIITCEGDHSFEVSYDVYSDPTIADPKDPNNVGIGTAYERNIQVEDVDYIEAIGPDIISYASSNSNCVSIEMVGDKAKITGISEGTAKVEVSFYGGSPVKKYIEYQVGEKTQVDGSTTRNVSTNINDTITILNNIIKDVELYVLGENDTENETLLEITNKQSYKDSNTLTIHTKSQGIVNVKIYCYGGKTLTVTYNIAIGTPTITISSPTSTQTFTSGFADKNIYWGMTDETIVSGAMITGWSIYNHTLHSWDDINEYFQVKEIKNYNTLVVKPLKKPDPQEYPQFSVDVKLTTNPNGLLKGIKYNIIDPPVGLIGENSRLIKTGETDIIEIKNDTIATVSAGSNNNGSLNVGIKQDDPTKVEVRALDVGLKPGKTVTVTITTTNQNATFVVTYTVLTHSKYSGQQDLHIGSYTNPRVIFKGTDQEFTATIDNGFVGYVASNHPGIVDIRTDEYGVGHITTKQNAGSAILCIDSNGRDNIYGTMRYYVYVSINQDGLPPAIGVIGSSNRVITPNTQDYIMLNSGVVSGAKIFDSTGTTEKSQRDTGIYLEYPFADGEYGEGTKNEMAIFASSTIVTNATSKITNPNSEVSNPSYKIVVYTTRGEITVDYEISGLPSTTYNLTPPSGLNRFNGTLNSNSRHYFALNTQIHIGNMTAYYPIVMLDSNNTVYPVLGDKDNSGYLRYYIWDGQQVVISFCLAGDRNVVVTRAKAALEARMSGTTVNLPSNPTTGLYTPESNEIINLEGYLNIP